MEGSVFSVAANGSSVQTARGPQTLLSSNKPLTKLDTTNLVSFQIIQLLFDHEPPQPPNSGTFKSTTLVYQFAHGYTYIPAVWVNWQNTSPEFPANPSTSGTSATSFFPNGDEVDAIIAQVVYDNVGTLIDTTNANLSVTVDDTNVNVYVNKVATETIGGSVIPVDIIGITLNLRIYVFTEPATTSTY